ncbi:HNH endonuclease [uncultured Bradyrhizobium sp.]|uniref:HNH endonuclease n=1 Tax=uncultured Bradyrhizobium sp. TaxID=199684 RepID=UPI0035C96B81
MSWGFEKGRLYNRRRDIHARFGGQMQGGIITPQRFRVVIIVTGEVGLGHGYADRERPDGVFEYFGEGQVGDMTMQRGNAAIAGHSSEGKSLLLFRDTRDGLQFVDEMVFETYHIERALDRKGAQRNAIVFELRPISAIAEQVDAQPVEAAPLDELLRRAMAAAGAPPPGRVAGFRNVYQRSADVRNYVLARAAGHCEGCKAPAPFPRKDGTPYLEPHHLRRVSDGGPDHPQFVIALCPNCHRRVHAGQDGEDYNSTLGSGMADIEPNVSV